jgi:TonB family protein
MMLAAILFLWSLDGQSQAPKASASACGQALAVGMSPTASEICLGEEQVRLADKAEKGSPDRARHWEQAAEHYRRAVTLASSIETKARALNAIVEVHDAEHLNDFREMEQVLRELIALQPTDLSHAFRLARVQEDRGLIDAAEATLLAARYQQPDGIEPYRALAQFYARRATALHRLTESQKPPEPTSGPGERDKDGVYRVGGPVAPPQRLEGAVYPPEAMAAGIEGRVVAEVVVNEVGDVTEARVVRSVPLLDEEALRTVRNWHFRPTIVSGQAVPVRMTVTVNFTTR